MSSLPPPQPQVNLDDVNASLNFILNNLKIVMKYHKTSLDFENYLLNNETKIYECGQRLNNCLKTIKNIKCKKRKLNAKDYLNKNCEMASKKMKEKHDVINELQRNAVADKTEIAVLNREPVENYITDQLPYMFNCYVCKQNYHEIHTFYDKLCVKCGNFNFEKRHMSCDFNGKIAVVTGCRIKIGYEICLYLLRHGCRVIGTTRFAKDAFVRYTKENDFDDFKQRLIIYPLDLRDLKGINKFVAYLYETLPKLDILINNAAQTIRRNVQFYKHLVNVETAPFDSFNNSDIYSVLPYSQNDLWAMAMDSNVLAQNFEQKQLNVSVSALKSQIPILKDDLKESIPEYPANVYDKDQQQVDLTRKTSWKLEIDEIDVFEFAETQVINSWAPFILCSKLKSLMEMDVYDARFIVNVSSMEGKFNRKHRTTKHTHTNMSKAALNMLTRTTGAYFAKSNIYLTSVDTGWVTEMNPNFLYQTSRTVPLDEIDGAMRVLDPIVQGINEKVYVHSKFYKDYNETEW